MKNQNSFIYQLMCVLLMSVGFNAAGQGFNFTAGPNWGPNETVQLEVQSECTNDGCPYAAAPMDFCRVTASVDGKLAQKFSTGTGITPAVWKLDVGWATETVSGTAGTVVKEWWTRCVAHNADIAKTFRRGTVIYYTTVNGIPTNARPEHLTQTISLFARAPGKPDIAQPNPCNPNCPQ
jgi:hypothetical protein